MSYPEPDEARKQTLLGLIETIKQQIWSNTIFAKLWNTQGLTWARNGLP